MLMKPKNIRETRLSFVAVLAAAMTVAYLSDIAFLPFIVVEGESGPITYHITILHLFVIFAALHLPPKYAVALSVCMGTFSVFKALQFVGYVYPLDWLNYYTPRILIPIVVAAVLSHTKHWSNLLLRYSLAAALGTATNTIGYSIFVLIKLAVNTDYEFERLSLSYLEWWAIASKHFVVECGMAVTVAGFVAHQTLLARLPSLNSVSLSQEELESYIATDSGEANDLRKNQALERIAGQMGIVSFGQMIPELWKAGRRVCKIEVGGNWRGTGFLVAPDIVLTNFHVIFGERIFAVEDMNSRLSSAEPMEFVFDVWRAGGERPFSEKACKPAIDRPILFGTPYAERDVDRQFYPLSDSWPSDELDFVLVRLSESPGDDPMTALQEYEVGTRGWLVPPGRFEGLLGKNKPIIVLQHSKGNPLQIAFDRCSGVSRNGTRVRYLTDTDEGASGSPCFSKTIEWCAVHHSGDPRWVSEYNQGIPVEGIVDLLIRKSSKELLGELKRSDWDI